MKQLREDRTGAHRAQYEKNKKAIFATQNVCGICGKPVDKKLKWPHPMSACIDHIIPVSKGGHPSDRENLQLAHFSCNRQKSDKLYRDTPQVQVTTNRDLPLSCDWIKYRSK